MSAQLDPENKVTFSVPTKADYRKPMVKSEPVEERQKPVAKAEPVEVEAESDETPLTDHPEPTDYRQHKGPKWVSKEEWQGDPDDWIPEKEFNKRKQLYETITGTKKQLKDQQDIIAELREHNRKVSEALRKQGLSGKLEQREAAIREGDTDRVYAIEREMQALDAEIPRIEQQPQTPQLPTHITDWVQENRWFEQNAEMRALAIGISQRQESSGDMRSDQEKLAEIAAQVRKRFPENFGGMPDEREESPRRRSVETPGSKRPGGKRTYRFSDLNDTQQSVCRKFVRKGVMTESQYIQQLADLGELK